MLVKCIDCGVERNPASKPGRCQQCRTIHDTENNRLMTIANLKKLGYKFLSGDDCRSHSKIKVKRISCGHVFEARQNNIITQQTKCGICGPKERIKKCMDGYMAKNARDYDMKKWIDYRTLARRLSNKIYKDNIHKLNPGNLTRSKKDHHLDHKVPLIVCFKEGVDVNKAASLQNLYFATARDNLSKNKHSYDKKLLGKLLKS